MAIKITLHVESISEYIPKGESSPVAKMIAAGTSNSIISINNTTVENREQAADMLQVVVDSLRVKKV